MSARKPKREPLNLYDRQQIARAKAEKLRQDAMAEAMELDSSLVGLLTGLGEEIRELRMECTESRKATMVLTDVLRGVTDELERIREQRVLNGHAKVSLAKGG